MECTGMLSLALVIAWKGSLEFFQRTPAILESTSQLQFFKIEGVRSLGSSFPVIFGERLVQAIQSEYFFGMKIDDL